MDNEDPPILTATATHNMENDTLRVCGKAWDPDTWDHVTGINIVVGNTSTCVSPDKNGTWAINISTNTLPTGLYTINLTAWDTKATTTNITTQVFIKHPDHPPVVSITYNLTDKGGVFLEAFVYDPDPWDSVTVLWYSDRDGFLGTTNPLATGLSPGKHVITCVVTDTGGLTATATLTIEVPYSSVGNVFTVKGVFVFSNNTVHVWGETSQPTTLQVLLDGKKIKTIQTTVGPWHVYTLVPPGTHTLTITDNNTITKTVTNQNNRPQDNSQTPNILLPGLFLFITASFLTFILARNRKTKKRLNRNQRVK